MSKNDKQTSDVGGVGDVGGDAVPIRCHLHRVIVTACNFPSFLDVTRKAHLALCGTIQSLVDCKPALLFCDDPDKSIDIRITDNRNNPELHILVQVYWPQGPVTKNPQWETFKNTTLEKFQTDWCTLFPPDVVDSHFTMLPTIENRPYTRQETPPLNLAQLPSPWILETLYNTQKQDLKLTVKPYATITNRERLVSLPRNDAMWDLLFKFASLRCVMTVDLLGTHIPQDYRMQNLLVDDQNELRGHAKGEPALMRCLPNRGVSVWFYTDEFVGNSSRPEDQSLLDAIQLFASGSILNTESSSIPHRTLLSLRQNDSIRTAMMARVSHIYKRRHLKMLQDFYKLGEATSHCLYVIWPCNDVTTGAMSFESHCIDLKDHLGRSSIIDLQYQMQQLILSSTIPTDVKKPLSHAMRDDLNHDHYQRYMTRTIDQFHSLYKTRDNIMVDRNAKLVEVGHGVLHPIQSQHVSYEMMLQYASPMILLVASEWADRVKEHLKCFRSSSRGLHITNDMLMGNLRGGLDSLSGDVGLYVAYYEVKEMEQGAYWFANCGKAPPPDARRMHTTCVQVDADLLDRVILEMRVDTNFLDDIYTDPIHNNHIRRNWSPALHSLRNIYTTPIAAYIPKPFEQDPLAQSARIIDVIRSPIVDERLRTLFKEASHLLDRSNSVETFLEVLTKLTHTDRCVDNKRLQMAIDKVLQQSVSRPNKPEARVSSKRKREALTLSMLDKTWNRGLETVSKVVQYGDYNELRRSLNQQETAFWVAEQHAYDGGIQAYHCENGEWTPCSDNDLLLAPLQDPEATLFAFTTQVLHAHDDDQTQLRVNFYSN